MATKGKKTAVKRTEKKDVKQDIKKVVAKNVSKKDVGKVTPKKDVKKVGMNLYSEKEIADKLGLFKETVAYLRRAGFIGPFKVASRVGYYTEEQAKAIDKMVKTIAPLSAKYFHIVMESCVKK